MATWTTIPDDFGSGGKGFSPSGSQGEPTLKDLLQEVQDNIDLNTDITDNTTAIGVNAAAILQLQTQEGQGNNQAISASGALSVTKRTSRITVSGTTAYTLADGTTPGQRKTLFCVAASGTPHGVITPTSPSGFATIEFATALDGVELEWDSSGTPGWKIVCVTGAPTIS